MEIVTVAEDLVDELLDGPPAIGLTSLKGVDSFLMGHLVDVAAVAVQLGRKAGLRGDDLRRLARGALVHDVGQVFGGENVDGKTGALSTSDVASLRRHTIVGYEFLRNVAAFDPLSNHVAYQHHERQDGLGYPRGLRGNNEVTRELNGNQGKILLLAEITAVADVYDALTSDHPDRAALPREFAFGLIARMAGSQLNRQLVELFLHSVPLFPAGYPVQFASGRLAGCKGVVARADSDATRPPIVRLLSDQKGRPIRPVEVDPSRYPGSRLVSDLPTRKKD
jgi:HD-GYP domain-containing protein (c-di-GMP phosphodiesterase class II)